jgi:integrase/recombinase XerD
MVRIMRIKMQQQEDLKTLEEAFSEFRRYCNVKNLAKDSIIFYENCFKSFTRYFPLQGSMNEISLYILQEYILWQKSYV